MATKRKKIERHHIAGSNGMPSRGSVKFSVLKVSEGGPGQKSMIALLKAAGIQCEACPSPYVGHSGIFMMGNKRELKRAERIAFG